MEGKLCQLQNNIKLLQNKIYFITIEYKNYYIINKKKTFELYHKRLKKLKSAL